MVLVCASASGTSGVSTSGSGPGSGRNVSIVSVHAHSVLVEWNVENVVEISIQPVVTEGELAQYRPVTNTHNTWHVQVRKMIAFSYGQRKWGKSNVLLGDLRFCFFVVFLWVICDAEFLLYC